MLSCEDAGANETAASARPGLPDAVVAAAFRSSRPEDAVVVAASRSGHAEDDGGNGAVAEGRSGSEDDVVVASRSTRPEDDVVVAASRSDHAENVGSDERLLSARGVRMRSDTAEATEKLPVRAAATTVPTSGYGPRSIQLSDFTYIQMYV
jgi:hypothetical protein